MVKIVLKARKMKDKRIASKIFLKKNHKSAKEHINFRVNPELEVLNSSLPSVVTPMA